MHRQTTNQAFKNNGLEVELEALGNSIAKWTDEGDRFVTAIPGLTLYRRDEPTQPTSIMYEPRILFGDSPLRDITNLRQMAAMETA